MVGAGLMGAGIAAVTAQRARLPVRLFDADPERARGAVSHARRLLERDLAEDARTERSPDASRGASGEASGDMLARLLPVGTLGELAPVDLVVEAVFEDLALKRSLLRELEAVTGPDCIFASNTSSLPLARLAEVSLRPHTVVGMHYFSPVHRMALLEVVEQPLTAPWVVETCVALGRAQGKTPIVVRDSPGFYTSRILLAYLNEAARLVWDGAEVGAVDAALEAFGFPVGPLKLLDEVGLDVAGNVAGVLHQAFGERFAPPPLLARLREDGRLGRKNGRGFYLYGETKGVDDSVRALLPSTRRLAPEAAVERTTRRMVDEALRSLDEGVLRSADDGDTAAVLGLGFPAARGGPFRYARSLGLAPR